MHPRTQELLTHLAHSRADLTHALASVPPQERHIKPGPDQWSVAEILEHLSIVETRIGDMVARDVTTAKLAGLGRETTDSSVLASLDVAGLKDRSQKRVASGPSLPIGTIDAAEAWTRLEASRARLEAVLRDADGWALETLSQAHPRLGAMNLYQWIGFVGAHESRHAAQIVETGAAVRRL
ncbi:MAG: DinB family protein [Acidobacteriota bacterium]